MTVWIQEMLAAVGMLVFIASSFVLALAADTLLA